MVVRISDFVLLNELGIDLFQREQIFRLQSLVYHQFCVPPFKEFLKKAFKLADILEEEIMECQRPMQCSPSMNNSARSFAATSGMN